MDYSVETLVLRVNPDNPDARLIRIAAEKLLANGLIAFPTETVYGLGANAFSGEAVSQIFRAKRRPVSDPIIVHIYLISQLEEVAACIPDLAWQLVQKFWPGPLTLVLKRHANIPANVSAGLDTVAVRMPNHKVPIALLRAAGVPIAAPSANLFTRPSPTTAKHVLEDLQGRVDIVLDSGPTPIGIESTVIDLTKEIPVILRPGGTKVESLRKVIPLLKLSPKYLQISEPGAVSASPGMLSKHYSPTAELLLFTGPLKRVLDHMRATAQRLASEGKIVGIMTPNEEHKYFVEVPAQIALLGSVSDLTQISRNLFAGMRELDRRGADVIIVRGFRRKGIGLAIWDRLLRAAEGRVVDVTEH
jgi:L-threonylcarbamoyladenylate synthase